MHNGHGIAFFCRAQEHHAAQNVYIVSKIAFL